MGLSSRHRLVALIVAIPGALACVGALAAFLKRVVHNGIAQPVPGAERQYYLEVGHAYSGGFTTGFFLCFFLVLMALATAAYVESRRAAVRGVR